MDWNNINRDRDTSGLGPIEYDQSKVPALIRKHADNVRSKSYGQQIREAQARNAEYAGLIAQEAKDISSSTETRQDSVEARYDVAVGAMTEDTEILDARVDSNGTTAINLKGRLDRYDVAEKRVSDFVLLSEFGLDDAGLTECLAFADTYKLGIIVDGMVSVLSPKTIGKGVRYIRGIDRVSSGFLPKGEFDTYVFTASHTYQNPLKISNFSANAYHMTNANKDFFLLDAGAWGASVIVENVNTYYFTGVTYTLRDAFNCDFDNVLIQGKKVSTKTPSYADWRSWIDVFEGIGVLIESPTSFSNVNTFNNVVFLQNKINYVGRNARQTIMNQVTFDQTTLCVVLEDKSDISLNSPWVEYAENFIINSKTDLNTLQPIMPITELSPLDGIKISNARGLYAVPNGEILGSGGVMTKTDGYLLNASINPENYKYFTWSTGIESAPLLKSETTTIASNGYTGKIETEYINQKFAYLKGDFTVGTFSGSKYLPVINIRSKGTIYIPVFKKTDNSQAGVLMITPYLAQNRSEMILSFGPVLNESYYFNGTFRVDVY